LFSVNEFAAAAIATPCSGSVATVTEASVTAAASVRPKLAVNSAVALTVAISRVQKDGKTIATTSATIANAGRK
jgi:hypothetical protein